MKKIYVVILFLVFFNVFTFLFATMDLFPYAYGTGNPNYNLTDDENVSSQQVFENSTGIDFSYGNVLALFLGDLSSASGILGTIALFGVGVVAAYLTRSPAPFVIVFVGNIMKNIYLNNMAVFNQFPVNSYLWLVLGLGMIILFLVTCAEYLTSGHGEV